MITFSLCLIVKNEEDVLCRLLDSCKNIFDEIIIVDTGSTDNTKSLAAKYTDKIFDYIWTNDFAAARNFAFKKATKDYIMWLDADDYLLETDAKKLLELKQIIKDYDTVSMAYDLSFDSDGKTLFSLRRNRLVKRINNFQWIGKVHEYLDISGKVFESDICIRHGKKSIKYSDRNLKIFQNQKRHSTRDLIYYANELFYHEKYAEAIKYYKKFLKKRDGWSEDKLTAYNNMADCFYFLGNREKEYNTVCQAMKVSRPKAELCCRLGFYFLQLKDYESAIFWYRNAMYVHTSKTMALKNISCGTIVPSLKLCEIYIAIGDLVQADFYCKLSKVYSENSSEVNTLQEYIEKIREKSL